MVLPTKTVGGNSARSNDAGAGVGHEDAAGPLPQAPFQQWSLSHISAPTQKRSLFLTRSPGGGVVPFGSGTPKTNVRAAGRPSKQVTPREMTAPWTRPHATQTIEFIMGKYQGGNSKLTLESNAGKRLSTFY